MDPGVQRECRRTVRGRREADAADPFVELEGGFRGPPSLVLPCLGKAEHCEDAVALSAYDRTAVFRDDLAAGETKRSNQIGVMLGLQLLGELQGA